MLLHTNSYQIIVITYNLWILWKYELVYSDQNVCIIFILNLIYLPIYRYSKITQYNINFGIQQWNIIYIICIIIKVSI